MASSTLVSLPASSTPTGIKTTLVGSPRSNVWTGRLVATLVPLGYMLLWWNRYLAPNSSGELLMMGAHSFDLLPYRDYQFQSPPGIPILLGWLGAVFGPRLIVPWLIGVLLNAAAALVLYFLLLDIARPSAAVVGTIATMVVATANSGETPFMYHHTSLTFALFGAFAGSRLLRATSAGGNLLLGLLAGAMIGVSFQVKQTVGGMNFLVLPAAVALISLRRNGFRTALLRVAAIGAGFVLSCVPAALWLWSHDLWPAFIDNAFTTGPKAKGDLWRIFLRPFLGSQQAQDYYLPPIIAVVFVAFTLQPFRGPLERLRRALRGVNWKRPAPLGAALICGVLPVWGLCQLSDLFLWNFIFGAIIMCLIVYALFPEKFKPLWDQIASGDVNWRSPILVGGLLLLMIVVFWFQWPMLGVSIRTVNYSVAALATFGCLLLIASSLPTVLRRDADLPAVLLFYAYCASFASGYGMAVSWPFDEYMAFPALGVVLAAITARRPDLLRPPYRRCAIALVATIVFATVYQKVSTPFFWGGWSEPPPCSSTTRSKLPQLDGFILSKETANFFDRVTDLIRQHSRPDETILVYPHMPVFYALGKRRPATRSLAHWFDTCPDSLALADAERIREKPPAVIVAMILPEKQIEFEERMFRNGQPSGQRVLWDAIEELTKNYDEVGQFEAAGTHYKIRVWSLRR